MPGSRRLSQESISRLVYARVKATDCFFRRSHIGTLVRKYMCVESMLPHVKRNPSLCRRCRPGGGTSQALSRQSILLLSLSIDDLTRLGLLISKSLAVYVTDTSTAFDDERVPVV